ncbi:MAG: long-chain fatty acid--CoA ligase [Vicinamibacteria bacterium]|nr:long-chain fatty acid--CoA ligase [Vicinamibacteria bacterium]
MLNAPRTVGEAVLQAAERWSTRPAHHLRSPQGWRAITWGEYGRDVRRAARAFIAAGVEKDEGVVIRGANRPEWYVAALGAALAGARPAGIYATSTREQTRYVTAHCDARVAVLVSPRDLDAVAPGPDLPRLAHRVLLDGADGFQPRGEPGAGPMGAPSRTELLRPQTPDGAMSWQDFLQSGDAVPESALEARLAAQAEHDVAALIYTSGTTGQPKAVMITHANALWVGREVVRHARLGSDDRLVSYLPLSHIAEQANSLYAPLVSGAQVHFVEAMEALPEALREVRPTMFLGVPRVYEKMQAAMLAAGANAPALRRRLVAWARSVGAAHGPAIACGAPAPFAWRLADKLVYSKVRERLGFDQVKLMAVSAAPMPRETLEYFMSLGVLITEIYGASEVSGPATVSMPPRYRLGTVGLPIVGTEAKLADDGEILLRGPNVFRGYLKDEAATAEVLDADGWYHTGDVGRVDADGYFSVTDRKKELLITSGGKNIAPAPIEARLKQIPGIGQAVALGDRRPYVAALLALDPQRLPAALAAAGCPDIDAAQAAVSPLFRAFVEREVERVNTDLARFESVRRFVLLPAEFSVEGGELTPTLKLRRKPIAEKYAGQIEALYS